MELINEDKKKKIYKGDNGEIYTLLNMGDYVGHKQRDFFDPVPDYWKLMYSTIIDEDGKEIEVSALIDDRGSYSRIIVEKEDNKRIIQLYGNFVQSDSIEMQGKKEDIIFEIQRRSDMKELNSYLSTVQNMQVQPGLSSLLNNEIITEFINKDSEIKNMRTK